MSDRIKNSWKVLKSFENSTGDYCVDIFAKEDGSFGFEEFRRDSEDMGRWTGINYYSTLSFGDEDQALKEALKRVSWLADSFSRNHTES